MKLTFSKEVKNGNKTTTITTELLLQVDKMYKEVVEIARQRKDVFVACEYGGHSVDISDIGDWDTVVIDIYNEERDEEEPTEESEG